jgi:hypothetical protein
LTDGLLLSSDGLLMDSVPHAIPTNYAHPQSERPRACPVESRPRFVTLLVYSNFFHHMTVAFARHSVTARLCSVVGMSCCVVALQAFDATMPGSVPMTLWSVMLHGCSDGMIRHAVTSLP